VILTCSSRGAGDGITGIVKMKMNAGVLSLRKMGCRQPPRNTSTQTHREALRKTCQRAIHVNQKAASGRRPPMEEPHDEPGMEARQASPSASSAESSPFAPHREMCGSVVRRVGSYAFCLSLRRWQDRGLKTFRTLYAIGSLCREIRHLGFLPTRATCRSTARALNRR